VGGRDGGEEKVEIKCCGKMEQHSQHFLPFAALLPLTSLDSWLMSIIPVLCPWRNVNGLDWMV